MKNAKKLLSVAISLIMVFSVFAVSFIGSEASDYTGVTTNGEFILTTGSTTATAARTALGETVHGQVVNTGKQIYYFTNDATRTITFNFKTSSAISVAVYSALNSVCISDTIVTSAMSKTCADLIAGGYYVEITGGAADATASYSYSTSCADLKALTMNINHQTASIISGQSESLSLSEISVDNLNYFWFVYNNPATTIDETKVVSVTKDGIVSVNDSEGVFNVDTKVDVYAVSYYGGQELGKVCTVTAVPGNVFLSPYYDTTATGCLTMGVGATKIISATTNLLGKTIVWSSSNTAIATVDAFGRVTGVSAGSATVSATVNGKQLHRDILVNVSANYYNVASVKLSANSVSIRAGENVTVNKTFTTMPAGGSLPTNDKVTYSTDNAAVATVDQNGKITAVSVGTAKITVTTDDGKYTDTCVVTVNEALPNWLMLIISPLKLIYNFILLILGK